MTDIPGYEGIYAITRDGRVWSYERKGYGAHEARFLMPKKNHKGYLFVILYKNTIGKGMLISRLVAMVYIPNIQNKPQVNHKNGIKTDNRVENLEWCTASENQKHASATGLRNSHGIRNSQARLTEEDVLEIRKITTKKNRREIAVRFDVSEKNVRDICARRRWSHI